MATLRPTFLGLCGLAAAVVVACGGSSNDFSDQGGEAGEASSGGSSAGTQSGGGTTGESGGGTTSTGGSSGSDAGGNGGTGATGGTASGGSETGGAAGEGATGGSNGGTAGLGGSAGSVSGGTGGQPGGAGGSGGMVDSRCPLRPPSGECMPDGLQCRYDIPRMCLCVAFSAVGCSAVDPRCTAMSGAIPPNGDRIVPVSIQTCDCSSGAWFCHVP